MRREIIEISPVGADFQSALTLSKIRRRIMCRGYVIQNKPHNCCYVEGGLKIHPYNGLLYCA